jgi:hypothetical protein
MQGWQSIAADSGMAAWCKRRHNMTVWDMAGYPLAVLEAAGRLLLRLPAAPQLCCCRLLHFVVTGCIVVCYEVYRTP